jgi:predicted amidohydrolase
MAQPRLGVAQFSGKVEWEENIAVVRRLAERAAAAGVNLLCLHEIANTIYPAFAEDPKLFALAEAETGPSIEAARKIARQHELVMVYPFFERDADRFYNSAIAFGPRGERLAKYRKTSIPTTRLIAAGREGYYFQPGDLGFPVFETPLGIRAGIIICYERNLPEPARCATLNGAELLFVPVSTTTSSRSRWEVLLRARAIENVVYVAAANRVGKDRGGAPDTVYYGESLVISPRGDILAQASPTDEDLVWADVDLELLQRQRRTWLFLADRRPDLYGAMGSPMSAPEEAVPTAVKPA